jgi:hypothetical protein
VTGVTEPGMLVSSCSSWLLVLMNSNVGSERMNVVSLNVTDIIKASLLDSVVHQSIVMTLTYMSMRKIS